MSTNAPKLVVRGLQAGYGDVQVLWDVSLDVAAGEIVCIIGSNGAGKSTLMRAMAGILPPSTGQVEVWGKNPDGKSGGMKFRKTLAAADDWQEVTVPIDETKIKPSATVYDITIFQVGKDKDARLFIKGVWVVKK